MSKISKIALTAIIVFLCGIAPVYGETASNENMQVIVNGAKLPNAKAILKNGETLLPFRAFIEGLGGKVGSDPETDALIGELNGETLKVWAGEKIMEYKQKGYYLSSPVRIIQNRTYLPIRSAAEVLGYEVVFEKKSLTVTLTKYGFGQDKSIERLLEGYMERSLKQPLQDVFIDGYEELIYLDEQLYEGYGPYQSFETWVGVIEYPSSTRAVVTAGYRSETQVLYESVETEYFLIKVGTAWKIYKVNPRHFQMELPSDVNNTVIELEENKPAAVQNVLQDLHAYYKAMNEENYDQAMSFTSPLYIADWNSRAQDWYKYEKILKNRFENTKTKEELLEARVLYMDDSYAAVHARILNSEQLDGEDEVEEPYEYELIISMDLIDGKRWTYNSELDINGDY